ncbi:MAG: peptidase M4 [Bacteroidota bacterium]
MDQPTTPTPSTPDASAAQAQSRGLTEDEAGGASAPELAPPWAVCIGEGVRRALRARPYERQRGDPVYRPLRIYTLDAGASRGDAPVARVNVPYEPLAPGPKGQLFEVEETFRTADGLRPQVVDLDAPRVLLESGRTPSPSDPQFHQQMVYAVCTLTYAAFRKALGRDLAWGFDGTPDADGLVRLRLLPHAFEGRNAYYDPEAGTLNFGYFRNAGDARGRNVPGGVTFTCLAHDIVAHEVTHALLDGLRAHFTLPTNPDVLAFHEALADLVAIFQRFGYPEVVRAAIRRARGRPEKSEVLTGLARQLARATGHHAETLRSTVSAERDLPRYREASPAPHARGELLIGAVFEAFLTVFQRKSARLLRLATGGTGILPEGDLPADLVEALADKACALAGQFLTICIRAVDYCPPVDIEFGEFLRAVITADYDLVPDDPWGYREAWIDAFQRRGIYPHGVASLSEDALLWRAPRPGTPPVADLSFGRLAFGASPTQVAGREELEAQATALATYLTGPGRLQALGLAEPGTDASGNVIDPPCIESVRPSRRVGPDGQMIFDLVAEVTQYRTLRGPNGTPMRFYGGATFILGPSGAIRYVVSKDPTSARRLQRQHAFVESDTGQRAWVVRDGRPQSTAHLFRLLHARDTVG